MPAPVLPGEIVELTVDALAAGASGVARLDGFVVFVQGGLPGDRVRARVERVRHRYADAVALEVIAPGPDRVTAPCAHYPACGGCRIQDLAYPAQARLKEAQVRSSLAHLGGLRDAEVLPIVPADAAFGYRNKLEYAFTADARGVALGLHRAGRFDAIVSVERCWLASDLGNALRDAARDWARASGLAPFDLVTHEGFLRTLVVREARNTGEALVALTTAAGELAHADGFVDALRAFAEVRSIQWLADGAEARVLWGSPTIEERIGEVRVRLDATSFLQPNTAMCERLYALVVAEAELTGTERVFDLYCGIGAIALTLAPHARSVFGVELAEGAIERARENATLNGVENATFAAGDVGKVLRDVPTAERPDVVVVDPPRAGLVPRALRRIGELSPARLVYVSCNPATLAANAKTLVGELGYRLVRATPIDMFPHTPHVEVVARFDRA